VLEEGGASMSRPRFGSGLAHARGRSPHAGTNAARCRASRAARPPAVGRLIQRPVNGDAKDWSRKAPPSGGALVASQQRGQRDDRHHRQQRQRNLEPDP
jgi:hypothetical protein